MSLEIGMKGECMYEGMCICNMYVNGLWNEIEMVKVNGNENGYRMGI